jgi:hypothetical protein
MKIHELYGLGNGLWNITYSPYGLGNGLET